MKRDSSDRPHGWPAGATGHRRHDGGSTMSTTSTSMSTIPAELTYDLIDRRMREASHARLASTAARDRTRDGHVVRFRGRVGRAIMAFGHALGGESMRPGAARAPRTMARAGRGFAEPGC